MNPSQSLYFFSLVTAAQIRSHLAGSGSGWASANAHLWTLSVQSLPHNSSDNFIWNLMSAPDYSVWWGNPEMLPHHVAILERKVFTVALDTSFIKVFCGPWLQAFPCCWYLDLIVLISVSKVNRALEGKCLDLEIPVCSKFGLMARIMSISIHFLLKYRW